jgi:CheY-like chemotaxis protein
MTNVGKQNLRRGYDHCFAPLNVLVVDDMPAIRRMLRQMLQALGVRGQIQEAMDGVEAWETLQEQFYELVVCDINMPRMNGLELLRRFRADPRYETTPFLMITGEVTEEVVAAAAESEVDGYLLKPFKINTLESRLRTIILNKHQPSTGESLFLKAKKLLEADRPQDAVVLLEKLLEPPFKKHAKVLNLLGECHLALDSAEQAASCFTQALKLNPQYLKSCQNLAVLNETLGNLTEARNFLEQARSLSPLNPERLFRLGQLCLKAGDKTQAQQYLKESLKCGHTAEETDRPQVAEVFLQAGMDQVAEDLFTQSIREQPDNVYLYNRLGIALRRQKKHQEALKCYQTALDLAPANERIYFNLGILYFDLGNNEKALQAFKTALKLRPDFAEAREFIHRHLLSQSSAAGPDPDAS